MKPTDTLSGEHRNIEQVLECLERIVEQAESRGRLPAEDARAALAFFRYFVDGFHHAKEEQGLFPLVEARFPLQEGGTTEALLYEHEVTRYRMRRMEQVLHAACRGEPTALRQFSEHARAYSNVLRNHIEAEDQCLYPTANQVLTEEDQRRLSGAFEEIDAGKHGEGNRQRYLSLAAQLAERFAVVPAVTNRSTDTGCRPS